MADAAPAPVIDHRPAVPEDAVWYIVPAGTRASTCQGESCRARMYWARTKLGKPVPIDCDVPGGRRPSETSMRDQLDAFVGLADVYDGSGISHFITCPDRELFSKGAR